MSTELRDALEDAEKWQADVKKNAAALVAACFHLLNKRDEIVKAATAAGMSKRAAMKMVEPPKWVRELGGVKSEDAAPINSDPSAENPSTENDPLAVPAFMKR